MYSTQNAFRRQIRQLQQLLNDYDDDDLLSEPSFFNDFQKSDNNNLLTSGTSGNTGERDRERLDRTDRTERGGSEGTMSKWGYNNRGNNNGNNQMQLFNVKLDLMEHDKEYLLTAELPGINKEDVKITVKDDIMNISGQKENKVDINKQNYRRSERSFGKFSRSIRLPRDVDESKITATQENGVLTVTIPRRTPSTVQNMQKNVPIK